MIENLKPAELEIAREVFKPIGYFKAIPEIIEILYNRTTAIRKDANIPFEDYLTMQYIKNTCSWSFKRKSS